MVVQNQNTKIFTEHGVTIASPLSIRGRTRWAELLSWAGRRRGRRAPSYSLRGHRHLCNKYIDVNNIYWCLKIFASHLAGPARPGWAELGPPTPLPAARPAPGPPGPVGTRGAPSSLGGGPSTVIDTEHTDNIKYCRLYRCT